MEHLLLEVWQRRRGRTLTLEAYAASGGVEGALAAGRTRSTGPWARAPGRRPARAPAPHAARRGHRGHPPPRHPGRADHRPGEEDEVDAVVGALAEARLVTTSGDEATGEPVVDVTHEALIRGWPELRGWINDDREQLRWIGGSPTPRPTGTPAAATRASSTAARLSAWEGRDETDLNELERFLAASRERAERERAARRRRTRITIGALAAGPRSSRSLGILALVSRNAGHRPARRRAVAAARRQLSRPASATRSSRRCWRRAPTHGPDRRGRGRPAPGGPRLHIRGALAFDGDDRAQTVIPSGDGRLVVGAYDGTLRLWDPGARSAGRIDRHPRDVRWDRERGRRGRRRLPDRGRRGDGRRVVAVAERSARASSPGRRRIYGLRVSAGRRVLTAGDGGVIEHDLSAGGRRAIRDRQLTRTRSRGAPAGSSRTTWTAGSAPDRGDSEGRGCRSRRRPEPRREPGRPAARRRDRRGLRGAAPPRRAEVVFSDRFQRIHRGRFRAGRPHRGLGGDGSVRVLDASGAALSRMTGHAGAATDVTLRLRPGRQHRRRHRPRLGVVPTGKSPACR